MLEDLVHNWLLLLGDLDSDPLGDDDGDAAADDVEAGFLLSRFGDECLLEEGVKVELIMQDVGGEANRCVDRVLEQDILILRRCSC